MSYFLSDFSILRPDFETPQQYTLEWLSYAHAKAEADVQGDDFDEEAFQKKLLQLLLRIGAGPGKIGSRGTHHPDFRHMDWEKSTLFPDGKGSDLGTRLDYFDESVEKIFEQFYPETTPLPEEIIHVSCTGYVAPSGGQKLAAKRNAKTTVTHAYHMGCYAAIAALRIAKGFSALGKKDIDIVHTEMCTLHMNPSLHTPEQLVVQSLFADGFIKYTMKTHPTSSCLEVLHVQETLLPGTAYAMTWQPDSMGFLMVLKKEVPRLIAEKLEEVVGPLIKDHSKTLFAIHPGGPLIIDQVVKTLKLEPWQAVHSRKALAAYGNMSSASLPYIWESMLNDPEVPSGTPIVSMAFGPGLTMAIGVLEKK